jgi:hypothetical protein
MSVSMQRDVRPTEEALSRFQKMLSFRCMQSSVQAEVITADWTWPTQRYHHDS